MSKIDHNDKADDLVRRCSNLLATEILSTEDLSVSEFADELRPIIDLLTQAVAHRCVAIVKESKRDK